MTVTNCCKNATIWSISRSKINKKLRGDTYVSNRRLFEKPFPVPLGNRVVSTPLASAFFRHAEILRQRRPAPRLNYFTEAFHFSDNGVIPHLCQGALPQCYGSSNRGKYPR